MRTHEHDAGEREGHAGSKRETTIPSSGMVNTIVIVGMVLLQAWVFADRWPREMVLLPIAVIVLLTIRYDLRRKEWGFAPQALFAGLIRAPAPRSARSTTDVISSAASGP
jgi:hypothetical protein